ncbi:MAG: hypothetical protein SOT70_05585 [Lachnospiraceae bacterium]|nr:hypothetical protein [Lachnospiraceae bacterium]
MSKKKQNEQTTPLKDDQKKDSSFHRYLQSLKDARQLEKDTMAQMETKREKIGYILYYHKWQMLIIFIVVFVIIYGAHAIITGKDTAFNCATINDAYNKVWKQEINDTLQRCITYDKKKEELLVSPYSTDISRYEPGYYGGDTGMQSIFAQMTDYRIDTIIAEPDVIDWFSRDDNFCDLKETLPSDVYATVKDYIVTCKDAKGNDIACGIDLSNTKLCNDGNCHLKKPTIAIFNTTRHLEEAISFIKEIFE